MPLLRFEVRNELGLANPELYRRGTGSDDDPKAVLDGVAVAGLIGILRQLGDLADFAGEVFHGLQEQIIATATRSHKLMLRARHIEDVLPPVEKAIFTQSSHIHFAYTEGCDWHTHISCKENHFIDDDLPRFIMDSYEVCHDPPRLHMLDKFDTGGPGSCLKRYSDPTFFRRTSKNSVDDNVVNVKTDNKKQKNKKRKSTARTRHLLHGGSLSNCSGRMQFTSPIIDGRTSTTSSIVEIFLKSERGDDLISIGSKSESGYIECAVEPSHSTQSKEERSWASSSYDLKPHDDIIDSAAVHKGARGRDDYFPQENLEESMASHSASVTWEEKKEVLEPNNELGERDNDILNMSTSVNIDALEGESKEIKNVDVVKVPHDDNSISNSFCNGNQLDGFNSEPENFMDAVNIMESESENELHCPTKREVKKCLSEVQKNGTQFVMHDLQVHDADSHCLSSTWSDKSAGISSSQGMPVKNPTETSSMHSDNVHVAHVEDESSDLQDLSGSAGCRDPKVVDMDVQSVPCSLHPVSPKSHDDKNEASAEQTGVRLWTNGGLLGLEPSKPPDFTLSNKVSQGPGINNTSEPCYNAKEDAEGGRCSDNVVIRDNQDHLKCSMSSFDDQGNNISSERQTPVSSFDVSTKLRNPSHVRLLNSLFAQGCKVPVSLPVGAKKADSTPENGDSSSRVFGLGHRLLINSFLNRQSSLHDDKVESIGSAKAGELDPSPNKDCSISQKIPETILMFKSQVQSPSKSWPPSPPLEHMKISFHPVCSFEKPKLRLKFLEKDSCQASSKDMFSSFQLVPESTSPLHDLGSDFDEDTLGRSSPSVSDDWFNHQSDSDSEQWDSDETQKSKGHEICDAVCRISQKESGSSSLEAGTLVNDASTMHADVGSACFEKALKNPPLSASSLGLPCYDSIYNLLEKDTSGVSDVKSQPEVKLQMKPAPPPPPLPPVQLCPLKSLPDDLKYGLQVGSEATVTGTSSNLHGINISLPTLAISRDSHLSEKASEITKKREQQDWLNLSPQKKSDQVANGTSLNEREDFLNQIRAKSFILRPTATASSSSKQGPTANFKVAAMLEKASAIRQVIGSDDGDDDAWSDI